MVGLVWWFFLCPQSCRFCGQGNGHVVEDLVCSMPLKKPQGSGQLGASGPVFNRLIEYLETRPQI